MNQQGLQIGWVWRGGCPDRELIKPWILPLLNEDGEKVGRNRESILLCLNIFHGKAAPSDNMHASTLNYFTLHSETRKIREKQHCSFFDIHIVTQIKNQKDPGDLALLPSVNEEKEAQRDPRAWPR